MVDNLVKTGPTFAPPTIHSLAENIVKNPQQQLSDNIRMVPNAIFSNIPIPFASTLPASKEPTIHPSQIQYDVTSEISQATHESPNQSSQTSHRPIFKKSPTIPGAFFEEERRDKEKATGMEDHEESDTEGNIRKKRNAEYDIEADRSYDREDKRHTGRGKMSDDRDDRRDYGKTQEESHQEGQEQVQGEVQGSFDERVQYARPRIEDLVDMQQAEIMSPRHIYSNRGSTQSDAVDLSNDINHLRFEAKQLLNKLTNIVTDPQEQDSEMIQFDQLLEEIEQLHDINRDHEKRNNALEIQNAGLLEKLENEKGRIENHQTKFRNEMKALRDEFDCEQKKRQNHYEAALERKEVDLRKVLQRKEDACKSTLDELRRCQEAEISQACKSLDSTLREQFDHQLKAQEGRLIKDHSEELMKVNRTHQAELLDQYNTIVTHLRPESARPPKSTSSRTDAFPSSGLAARRAINLSPINTQRCHSSSYTRRPSNVSQSLSIKLNTDANGDSISREVFSVLQDALPRIQSALARADTRG